MIILFQSKLQCLHHFVYIWIYNPESETKSQVRESLFSLSFGVPLYFICCGLRFRIENCLFDCRTSLNVVLRVLRVL